MPTINERVALLRAQLKKNNLDAWIINGTDPHQSEYVAPRWRSREWISGFSGSAGSVLVTADEALLWVDSRYFIQGEEQIAGTEFTLMKLDTPGYPDMNTYLKRKLKAGSRVGIAQEALTISARALYESAWAGSLTLVAMEDILDAIWADRPAVPSTPVIQVADDLAGFSAEQKLAMVRTALGQSGGDWTIIASLDDIAWLTNLRASDVSYNPVFYSATRRSSLSTGAGSLMRSSLKRKPHLPLNPMRRPPKFSQRSSRQMIRSTSAPIASASSSLMQWQVRTTSPGGISPPTSRRARTRRSSRG